MLRGKLGILANSLESLLAKRRAVAAEEKKLVRTLSRVLGNMGYQVVELGGGARGRPGRRRGGRAVPRRGRKRGRPAKGRGKA